MEKISKAVKILKTGGIVVYPTDTAYGLAVDATNAKAVTKLYRLKGRDFRKPIHVIVPKHLHTVPYASNKGAERLMKKFWPGPLTIVLPLSEKGKSWKLLSAGTKTIGIRLPNHKLALDLAKKFGKPITATSANVSGQTTPYSIAEVKKQFKNRNISAKGGPASGGKPDFYLDGGKLKPTKPSTVVMIRKNHVKILRLGPIKERQIKSVFSDNNTTLFFSSNK